MANESRDRFNCIVSGYIRRITAINCDLNIPQDIHFVILLFHGREYKIYGIGRNSCGELGCGNNTQIPNFTKLESFSSKFGYFNGLAVGWKRFMILTSNNELYGCGQNEYGEIGANPTDHSCVKEMTRIEHQKSQNAQTPFIIKLVSSGLNGEHSFIVTQNDDIYVWGRNHSGQHGLSEKSNYLFQPTLCEEYAIKETLIKITCGFKHTLFLTKQGNVYSCGDNSNGQCGIDDPTCQFQLTPYLIEALSEQNIFVIDVCCGDSHSLLVDSTHSVIGFGCNDSGQLADSANDNANDAEAMTARVYGACSRIMFFETRNIQITRIRCGQHFSLCLNENGKECYLFGANDSGQIGYQSEDGMLKEPMLFQNSLKELENEIVMDGQLGSSHTLILTKRNNLYAFGNNSYSQCTKTVPDWRVFKPHLLDKKKEIGIDENTHIRYIFAGNGTSLIICD